MKIVTVNRNYFITGGPEKYLFSLKDQMKSWEFIPFAVNFASNLGTPYQRYFVSPPSDTYFTRFGERDLAVLDKLKYASKTIYSFEAKKKLKSLITHTHPQAAFFLNAVYFSQSIIDACKELHVPIVWRLSDFNLICGTYLLFRNKKPCTECLDFGMRRILLNKCGGYQNSLMAALVRFLAMKLALLRDVYSYVSYFVCPSEFMKKMMVRGGFSDEKLIHIPTSVSISNEGTLQEPNLQQFAFIGRISPEKGLDVLLRAVKIIGADRWKLIVVGGSYDEYKKSLVFSSSARDSHQIEFDGFVSANRVRSRIRESLFVVVPSLWYENIPNVVLEAMALGRPVIASRIGSLPELVREGETGLLFEPGNEVDLAAKIDEMLGHPKMAKDMGCRALEYVKKYHDPKEHIAKLKELFYSIV